ncbi:glycosyltransferase family 39 protein [Chitinophaga sp. YIM B06452]|uniref:ArnT family glycosyltransferase n=1 Tax=Chitinophaga sp. YIM B06452 TaxID=3082158 RepID=UPI0031FEA5EC
MIRFFTKDQYKNGVLLLWAVLALFQAGFTELMDDEAYYWVYSRHLDWGYFDHPPMIALLIKAGYALFHNELGVRLGMVALNVGTLILTDRLIPQKDNRVFYLILAGMGAMQLGGMLAVPDLPLIFFAALYFYIYRGFLESQSWKNTLLLGFSMALMFYSKYHGILLVFFTVLSNLSLLRLYRFWIAVLITTALFFPHLYWQYTHGFPSLQYHLVERNSNRYHYSHTLDYVLGQVLLFGPLVGWLILYYAFRTPVVNAFERALKFSLVGVLVFFLFSTFKGRVEANWTVMIFTPMFILAHQGIVRQGYSPKIFRYTWVISLLLVCVTRVYMVWDFMPGVRVRPEIHHNREWTAAIAEKAGGRPVVFLNSYQRPSKYMFYTGHESYSLNTIPSRRSQYNFWHTEEDLWGKEVLISAPDAYYFEGAKAEDTLMTAQGDFYNRIEKEYYSYSLIQFIPAEESFTIHDDRSVTVRFAVKNGYDVPVKFPASKFPEIGYTIWNKNDFKKEVHQQDLREVLKQDSVDIVIYPPAGVWGEFKVKAGISAPPYPSSGMTHNSPVIKLHVEF